MSLLVGSFTHGTSGPHPMRFNASPCSRSSRASSRSIARVPPFTRPSCACSLITAISCEEMFRGTVDSAQAYPREVVKRALVLNAAAVIWRTIATRSVTD